MTGANVSKSAERKVEETASRAQSIKEVDFNACSFSDWLVRLH